MLIGISPRAISFALSRNGSKTSRPSPHCKRNADDRQGSWQKAVCPANNLLGVCKLFRKSIARFDGFLLLNLFGSLGLGLSLALVHYYLALTQPFIYLLSRFLFPVLPFSNESTVQCQWDAGRERFWGCIVRSQLG